MWNTIDAIWGYEIQCYHTWSGRGHTYDIITILNTPRMLSKDKISNSDIMSSGL